ncbi:MAG: hypothetical protein WA945_03775, partial [Arcobacteraceae bacterium]
MNKIVLSDNFEESNRETIFIEDICKRVSKSKSVLYCLEFQNEIIGLVAISTTEQNQQPSLQIDYILVNHSYRGKVLKSLDTNKPFRYLIELVIDIATEIQKKVGLRYIVLSPDNYNLLD